jgi:adenylate kinase family enzyme
MKAIVLLGVPGAGTGTVAEFVAQHTTYRQLSTGSSSRVNSNGTELGRRWRPILTRTVVPDQMC